MSIVGAILCALVAQAVYPQPSIPNSHPFSNPAGLSHTVSTDNQPVPLDGPFFQSLGSNGRSCASCHRPGQGWSISAAEVQHRFQVTQGLDPIFRPNDGANCDHNIDTSTFTGRRDAYSLLRMRGLIRVALDVPAGAEFTVLSVANRYGCSDPSKISVYRRPLPATNLRFLSTLMWDGRESSPQTGTQKITFPTNPGDLLFNLAHQALDATNGHAQAATPLTEQQQKAIVDFEMSLVTAQSMDHGAGPLDAAGGSGGAGRLAAQTMREFYIGINDPLNGNPYGRPFSPVVFDLYDGWNGSPNARRASIARGQAIFNSKQIAITNVGGLNDDLDMPVIPGTCGTCHDSPNVGNHSVSMPLNIGVSDVSSPLDTSYLPVITLRNNATGEIKLTTDPGRALITGLWKDVGRFKGPVLRGLASRAPYFHNGSAATLEDVLEFYAERFGLILTPSEKKDLVAFLNAL